MKRTYFSRLRIALFTALSCGLVVGCTTFLSGVMGVPGEASGVDTIKFNHEFHIGISLSKADKERAKTDAEFAKTASNTTCNKCHKPIDETRGDKAVQNYKYPGHVECGECHATEITKDCLKCHSKRPEKGQEYTHEVTGELIFNHPKHTANADKNLNLTCDSCHTNVAKSRSTKDYNLPSMWDCRDCHGGINSREKDGAVWECGFCHTEYVEGFQPRTHLGSRPEIPASHDVTFRTSHGRFARVQDSGCDRCHNDTSCDRCHFSEQPRDHTPRFFKSDHGREATHDRDRCAACHEAGFCIGCHSIEPSTHFQVNFQSDGHAFLARRDLRACFACHQFADTCSDCHNLNETTAFGQ